MTPTEPLVAARAALAGTRAWLVGGAIRDRLLHRVTDDVDLAIAGDVRAAARTLARGVPGSSAFPLSEAFGAWRVVAPRRAWRVDLVPLAGETIEADLARRDFTVNAIAQPLSDETLIDPFGGAADLAERRLRMVAPQAFADDPLRALRAARLACELGLEPDLATARAARAHAPRLEAVAGERIFAELRRIVCAPAALPGLELMEGLGITPVILPELSALHGVRQGPYHHLDVHEHTMAVLAEDMGLERDPEPVLGEHAAALSAFLDEPLADELTRAQALRIGALLHDAAKPATRGERADGRPTFIGHDQAGAVLARAVLGRLRVSERLRAHVAALVRHHLRLGFLVHERPLSRRAVYGYLRDCEPVEVDVTILSVADRLATRGRRADEAIAKHLDLARELLGEALRRRASGPGRPLLRGDELADELGLAPGPEIGRLLAALDEARFAGDIASRADALALARRLRG